jgi:hypothetical protein
MNNFIRKFTIFLLMLLLAQAILSLSYEVRPKGGAKGFAVDFFHLLRISIPDPDAYRAPAEILAIQQHQRIHRDLGFLWEPNIDTSDNVVIQWGDAPAGALCTDEFGFVNTAEAIAGRRAGMPVDIVGVGASYMGGAQGLFHEYFDLKGLSYYNLANNRFTIPQYNIALKAYALPMKPRWVVYGLNEVSFLMIDDFGAWKKSGKDWFAFHSGCWCGPPIRTGFPYDQLREINKPLLGLSAAIERKLFPSSLTDLSEARKKHLADATRDYVLDAYQTARQQGIGFILLLIPAKSRMVSGPSPQNFLFEQLLPQLASSGMTIVDLRKPFSQTEDPRSLYFAIDNHWNRQGIYIAAQEILRIIRKERS